MRRTIKVEDEVYEGLDRLRGKGETFNSVIEQLLGARLKVMELVGVLEGPLKFREWQREQLETAQKTER